MDDTCVMGIDLAGVPHRPTGLCILSGYQAETWLVHSDEEIINAALDVGPEIIAVDAPLSLPPGRTSLEDRNAPHYRPCDLMLRRRKIPILPVTLGPMRLLTKRGMVLKDLFADKGFRCIEVYPGGAQDIWGIPRSRRDRSGLLTGLEKRGLKGLKAQSSGHELDAATAALVGHLFLSHKAKIYGRLETCAIIMPRS